MASSSAIRAGRAFVELFADDKPLVRGLNAAKARMNSWATEIAKVGAGIAAAGTAVLGPLLASAKKFSDVGSDLADMSGRTGIAVEQLSALKYASDQSGTSMEGLEKGVRKMQGTITDAVGGSESAADAFKLLNINLDEIRRKSPDEQFLTIADALAGIENPTTKAALAMKVFGRSGAELLPLMQSGAAGIREMMAEARELGLVMSTEDAAAADLFGDVLGKVQATVGRLVVSIGSALAPALTNIANLFAFGNASIGEWIRQNGDLVRIVALSAAGMIAAGGAIMGLGVVIKVVAAGFGVAATAIAATAAVAGALLTPVGAITAALVGGIAAWLTYSNSGQAALASLAGIFAQFQTDAMTAIQGISDALAAGDLKLAVQVAMAAIELWWTVGTSNLKAIWAQFTNFVQKVFIDLSAGLQGIWIQLFTELSRAFPGLVKIAAQSGSAIKGFFENIVGEIGIELGLVDEKLGRQTLQTMADDRAKELEAEIRKIEAAHDNPHKFQNEELAKLERARTAAQEAREKATGAEIQAAEASLQRARAALVDATKRAGEARARIDVGTRAQNAKGQLPDMSDIEDKLAEAANVMSDAEDKIPDAMAIGSKEAAEHILKSFAAPKAEQDLIRQQLKEARNQTNVLKRIDKGLRNARPLNPSTI